MNTTCTETTSRFLPVQNRCQRPLPVQCNEHAQYIIVRATFAMDDQLQTGAIQKVEQITEDQLDDILAADHWLMTRLAECAGLVVSSSFGEPDWGVPPTKVVAIRLNDGGAFQLSEGEHVLFYERQPRELVEAARWARAHRQNPDAQF